MPSIKREDDVERQYVKERRRSAVKREDDVERQYVKDVEDHGGECLKVKVLGRPGYPDRLVLRGLRQAADLIAQQLRYAQRDGLKLKWTDAELFQFTADVVSLAIHFTELKKTAKSRYQPKQKPTIAKLRKMGYRVDVVHG